MIAFRSLFFTQKYCTTTTLEYQNNEEDDNQENNPSFLQSSNSINSELLPQRNKLSKVERLKLFSSIALDQDPPLNDIILGLLLGDGHIERRWLKNPEILDVCNLWTK